MSMMSQWCHPTISFTVAPFSSYPQSFPMSGSLPVSRLFASGDQTIGASASASVLSMNCSVHALTFCWSISLPAWQPFSAEPRADQKCRRVTAPRAAFYQRHMEVNVCALSSLPSQCTTLRCVLCSLLEDPKGLSSCCLINARWTAFPILHGCFSRLCSRSVTKLCPTLLRPPGLYPTRLLCPWNFPGKNTGVGCHFLLQEIFLTQGSNSHLPQRHADSLPLSHLGNPS